MTRLSTVLVSFVQVVAVVLQASGAPTSLPEPNPSFAVTVTNNGVSYVNKGLVAFGFIPSTAQDFTGDTLGGIGSAIALKDFKKADKGQYKGTLYVQPDRGFNIVNTVDYQARRHRIDFTMTPYYGTANLNYFTTGQATLKLEYKETILHSGPGGIPTSGLDPLAVLPGNPPLPIAGANYRHMSVDAEGLVLNDDGSVWVSDEYGPYIYRFGRHGEFIQAIAPPAAILPHNSTGGLNFTAGANPTTGRQPNQGFEGLTMDRTTNTLYALLQSAAWQDGGAKKSTARYTRLLAWDVSHLNPNRQPPLVGEWVIPLPLASNGNALASSDLHFISKNIFMALPRDGNAGGSDTPMSNYKHADLYDISGATNIHGTQFDDPAHPIAVAGVLNPTITPAKYISFVDYLNPVQLARFGLHNGLPADRTLICSKWESLALAPVDDPKFPNDYFLFTASDNDFQTTQGFSVGQPYNAGLDNDNQFLVFRVTLPGVKHQNVDF